ncbi:MAG: sulfite exporter TauE/SafE family protein [Actinomycetota bacterium]|nr:sulfite exporter TauE/SafE family protein [Actinomycetota bacterium]
MRLVLIGLVAGFFSALFGVGGGLVIVPLLLLLAHWEERPAMATSLAAIGLTALAGAILYALYGKVDPSYAALVGLPAAVGAVAGTALQQRIRRRGLSLLFALLIVGVAISLLIEPPRLSESFALAALLGLAAGVLAGLFGVGGGILFVPTLLALGLSQLHAEATSLLAILPTAVVATWRQTRYGNVRWRSAGVIGVSSLAGAGPGVLVATNLPEVTLRRLFAALMLAVAAQLAWRSRRP